VEVLNYASAPLSPPFTWFQVDGTRYRRTGALTVWHAEKIEEFDAQTTKKDAPQPVLEKGNPSGFSLVIPPRKVDTTGSNEIDSLVRPFFYQDNKHTFYVEPTVTEQVFHEWEDWIVATPDPKWEFDHDIYWEEAHPPYPWGPIVDPNPPDPISPYAIFAVQDVLASNDSVLAGAVTVPFGESWIGAEGAING
jgi:hypothetical protein